MTLMLSPIMSRDINGALLELFEPYHLKQGWHSSDEECYNMQPFIRAFQRCLSKTVVDSTYRCIWAVCNVRYNIVLCWIVLLRNFTERDVRTIQFIYAPNSVKVISFRSDVQYRKIRFRFSNWFAGNWRKKRQRLTGINTILIFACLGMLLNGLLTTTHTQPPTPDICVLIHAGMGTGIFREN